MKIMKFERFLDSRFFPQDAVEGINFTSTSQAIMVIADMLMDYNRLFDVDETEMQKESRIQQIAKDLNSQPQLNKVRADFGDFVRYTRRKCLFANLETSRRRTFAKHSYRRTGWSLF